ncbi:Glycogen branching enzyme, GH-57-type, archaeal [hydrothermal vent metagenome]|uniref:Glycogen branching enzyme, GH-57-type, archaeal n=1 Tax=hydrothermal vent metagenome TaxID=652676 RepID=A0A3B1C1Y9_9ZZZZ
MPKSYLCLVLHAHLPFVRHPEHEEFLEEDWLFEAIIETYLPLLSVFEGLERDQVRFRLTMSLTPTLIFMLNDPLLRERFLNRINKLVELSEKELHRTRLLPKDHDVALMYHWKLTKAREQYEERYQRDIVMGFARLMEQGYLEIIASAATHGFLPSLSVNPKAVKAQIKIGCDEYERAFGRRPRGIWLPECGYHPSVEESLKEEGILYFFVDAHGILHAGERPRYGVYAPVVTGHGIAAFGRDIASSRQVWSSKDGYPGDPVYRDFYRDIGFDLDLDYIRPYIQATGHRKMTGIKYHRITGPEDEKEIYIHHEALEKAARHAEDFITRRVDDAKKIAPLIDRPPLVVAPYDAELFGHWWYEGPEFLNFLFRKLGSNQGMIESVTPLDYLKLYPKNQVTRPSISSWGNRGFSDVWLSKENSWIYPHLHKAADRMTELAKKFYNADGACQRALNQAARELLLAQSSDWAFIMKTGTMVAYGRKRTKDHLSRFNRMYDDIKSGNVDKDFLKDLESKDNIFPDIDYRVYA